jgi:hypothetical protein
MRYSLLISAVIITATIASCGSSSSEESSSTPTTQTSMPATTVSTDTTIKPGGVQPTQANPQLPAGTLQPIAPVVASGAGLNPKHGMPGHRCDIAEGAPLNSSPTIPTAAKPATATAVPAAQPIVVTKNDPVMVNPAVTKNQVVTAAGMNPEHGKPGHRCDIAVGAPLNSKPTVATPAPTPTPAVSSSIPQATPVQQAPVAPDNNNAVTAPGMNPEHGKPGHRCDIAVGAPLNSKPAAK